jgi:hypothetical protein
MGMLRTTEINTANTVSNSYIANFLTNDKWTVHSTSHTVLKAFLGAAMFGWDMLFDMPFIADWNKIGRHRQHQTNRNTACETNTRVEWVYKIGDKVLVKKMEFSAIRKPV